MSDLVILAWLSRMAQELRAPYEVLDYLRNQERAAMQLVVRRISTDSWLVGRLDHPVAFSPRGSGMLPLALLLNQRGERISTPNLVGEPCDVRALAARVRSVIEELCAHEPAFDFLRATLHLSGECLRVSNLAGHPRVTVDLGIT